MTSKSHLDGLVTEAARRDTFRISASERGTVDSLRNSVLTSTVSGTTTIIKIVPEGSQVKAGDILCELDSSMLVEKVTAQQIRVTQAVASLEQATKQLQIQEQQNQSDIAAAELKLRLAQLDLLKFEEGDFLQQENELLGQVTLAKENQARAVESRDIIRRLAKKGYRTRADLDVEDLNVTKTGIELAVAEEKLKLLKEYTYTRTLEELRANAKEFERELTRVKLKALAALAQAKADLQAKELTEKVEQSELARLDAQVAACVLKAPQDGQVVYANPRDSRSDQPMIEEGTTVRERQAIINLPDLTAMKVVTRVHESRISMIRTGLPALVKIDAYPDELLRGVVDSVGSVPTASNSWNRDIKEYEAVIRIVEEPEKIRKLRPGLTAGVDVLVEERADVLQVPIQSIITIGAHHFTFVAGDRDARQREVKIGQTNDRMVEILDGVKADELVVMNPRSQFVQEIANLTNEFGRRPIADETTMAKIPPLEESPAKAGIPAAAPSDSAGEKPSASPTRAGPPGGGDPLAFFKRMDKNGDARLTEDELIEPMRPQFANLDADGDGVVSEDEFKTARTKMPGGRPRAETETALGGGG